MGVWEQVVNLADTSSGILAGAFVPVIASFEASGAICCVEPWIEGQTLMQHVAEKGRLPEEQILMVGTALIEVLSTLHAKGLIHGDVSASNIMLSPEGRLLRRSTRMI